MRTSPLLAMLFCAGCAANGIPREVLAIARSTKPGGDFHIEVDSKGRVVEAGAAVALDSVPAPLSSPAHTNPICPMPSTVTFMGGGLVGSDGLV